jgi:hypothetical protein
MGRKRRAIPGDPLRPLAMLEVMVNNPQGLQRHPGLRPIAPSAHGAPGRREATI